MRWWRAGGPKTSFDQLRKLLKLSGSAIQPGDAKRTELKGNATSAALARKDLLGAAWAGFAAELQDEIIWQIVNEEGEAR